MNRIGNKPPSPPKGEGDARKLDRQPPRKLAPSKRPISTSSIRPSEFRVTHDLGSASPNDVRGNGHAARRNVNLEKRLLRALLSEGATAQLLRPSNVRQGLDDLKNDWAKLLDDREDPLLQVAELALEHCDLDLRDLQRTLQLLIAP